MLISVGREVKGRFSGGMQSLTCEVEVGSPIEYVQVRSKACKENDMTIFVFEERNSGSSMGVRQRAEMDTGKPAGGSFQNR